jgi:hypothetical protein
MKIPAVPRGTGRALMLFACLTPLGSMGSTLSTIQFNTTRINSLAVGQIQDTEIGFSTAAPTATIARDTTSTVNGTVFAELGFAEASTEALRVSGSITATAGPAAVSYLSEIQAFSQGGFRIDSAQYNGQVARVEYALDVSGLLDVAIVADGTPLAGAFSNWRLTSGCANILLCAQTSYQGFASFASGVLVPSGDSTGLLSFVIEVPFGTTIDLLTSLLLTNQLLFGSLQTGVGAEGVAGSASADFTNTVVWGGMRGVTLTDGTVVTDWTTTSGSGFDYGSASVIPLPAAAWLLGSGLLGLAGLRRRGPVAA